MSTDEEQQATLADELESAFDEIEQEPIEESPAEEQPEPEPEVEALEAPQNWKSERRDWFNKLAKLDVNEQVAQQLGLEGPVAGREYQQMLLDFHNEMQGDYTRKTQEIADVRRQWDGLQQHLQPFTQSFAARGIYDPIQGVLADLTQYHAHMQQLQTDPQGFFNQLAQQYQIDLNSLAEGQPFVTEEVKQLQQQIAGMQQQYQTAEQQQAQQRQNAAVNQITAFEQATDEQGNPKHPHFQTLFNDMQALLQMGRATSLEDAYSLAEQFSPDIQQSKQAEQEKEIAAQKRAEAEKAKAASRTIRSKEPAGKTSATDKSWGDSLEEAAAEIGFEFET